MSVQVSSLVNYLLNVPGPIELIFEPRQVVVFPYIEYDSVINDERIDELIQQKKILVEDLETGGAGGLFVSQWDLEPKLRLQPYVYWVDTMGQLRMKNGDPTSDIDGTIVGPGGVPGLHGPTHVFTGSDPVPDIEVLEEPWNCTVTEVVLDAVYTSASDVVIQASNTSMATMPVVGLVISKPTSTTCILARSGELSGFIGLTPGALYFAGIAGALTTTPPVASGSIAQHVGYAKNTTTLVVERGIPIRRA